jgi:hypothetical protein
MNYLQYFFDRNSSKPFFTNLMKYDTLTIYGKQKCIASFFTHLIIDIEIGLDKESELDNKNIQVDVISILNNFILAGEDTFMTWLRNKLEN